MTQTLVRALLLAALAVVVLGCLTPLVARASAEQASSGARSAQGGYIDAGEEHTCAVLADRSVRCWGKGVAGRLGYGNDNNVLVPAAAGPVNLGPGRDARAIVAGDFHTCAILDEGTVRCWGFGENGRLGYGNKNNILTPAAAPPVDLGPGRTARAITAGASHTCAILDDGSVRCWGNGAAGRLGYGNATPVGDDETPGQVGPVNLGPGRTARAIAAGEFHTCAILDDSRLLCWGFNASGQLGYGGTGDVGDNETPGQVGPVNVGGRGVVAVSGGTGHTCAILDDGTVHCWGFGANGRLGYGSTADVPSAAAAPAVNLGAGRTASAIAAGDAHNCAILDDGAVRCWGFGGSGRLGYGNTTSIGDTETPDAAGPVNLGPGRSARALTAGFSHSCAALDDGTLRCWGFGGSGRLGYGNELSVGDDETPASAGPVPLGGSVPSLAANVTVGLGADRAQPALGDPVVLTVTVGNAGPDATGGVALSVPAPPGISFLSGTPSAGTFDGNTGRWSVGTLVPGQGASLRLVARAGAAGTIPVAAEVASSSVFDPTSTPANGASEDDRAVVVLTVPGPPGIAGRLLPRPRGLSLTVTRVPRRGTLSRIGASGRLLLPRVRPVPRCAGKVRVRATVGKRVVAQRTVRLRRLRGACRYSTSLRPGRTRSAKAVIVRARFLGTSQMRPRDSRATGVKVRVPLRR
jgi:uncharacterized repeat protein (TIGR01451 family)